VNQVLTPRELVNLSPIDLFASIGHPVAHDLRIETEQLPSTTISPEPPSTVFAGNPLVIFGETGAREGKVHLRWQSDGQAGTLECPLNFEEGRMGDTVRLIRGARLITDLESRFDDSEMGSAVRQRTEDRIANKLELLSKTFGLASRRMALVAVIERESDQPDQLPETRVVPVGMPQDVSFDSYFGAGRPIACLSMATSSIHELSKDAAGFRSILSELDAVKRASARIVLSPKKETDDLLLSLASEIEPDGGM